MPASIAGVQRSDFVNSNEVVESGMQSNCGFQVVQLYHKPILLDRKANKW
jgi:hypothetical protein